LKAATGNPAGGKRMAPSLGTNTPGSEWLGVSLEGNIDGYQAFSERGEPMGTVQDDLFDEAGSLRRLRSVRDLLADRRAD
jgi:hypothetical protein